MATNRYAVVRTSDSKVVNLVTWDGDTTQWQPPAGHTARIATASDAIGVPVEAQNAATLEQRIDQTEEELRRYLGLTDAQAATAANMVRVLRWQARVLIALIRLRSGRLEGTAD